MVGPHGLVSDPAGLVDDVDHVWHRAVTAVYCALEIVHQDRHFDPIFFSTITCESEFLLPAPMRAVMFARVGLAHVDREKLKALIPVAPVKFVQRRDLAHERRSGDTAKFQ